MNFFLDGLSAGFPRFKLVYDDQVMVVSISLDDERVPVVKAPVGTIARVLPEDDKQPERVLFQCPEAPGVSIKRYIIKHQSGPGQASSGFLHLFGTARE